jgi:hypothetical protein
LEKFFDGRAEILATIMCGDNYFAENQERATKEIMKLAGNEKIGSAEEEGYIPQGYKANVWSREIGAVRVITMLLRKMKER